jgi:hypothetical protein
MGFRFHRSVRPLPDPRAGGIAWIIGAAMR